MILYATYNYKFISYTIMYILFKELKLVPHVVRSILEIKSKLSSIRYRKNTSLIRNFTLLSWSDILSNMKILLPNLRLFVLYLSRKTLSLSSFSSSSSGAFLPKGEIPKQTQIRKKERKKICIAMKMYSELMHDWRINVWISI